MSKTHNPVRELAAAYFTCFSEGRLFEAAVVVASCDIMLSRIEENKVRVIESFAESLGTESTSLNSKSISGDQQRSADMEGAIRHLEVLSRIESNQWAKRTRALRNFLEIRDGHGRKD